MKKRIFALALALCMMLSVMPTSFAGNGFLTDDSKAATQSGVLTDDSKTVSQSGVLTGASKYYRQDGILYNTGSQSGASYSLPSGTLNAPTGILTLDENVDSTTTLSGSGISAGTRSSALVTDDKNGLELAKKVDKVGDNYKITLEAYVTGKKITTTHTAPMDIVLVLDQSGSMADDFNGNSTETDSDRRQYAMKQAVNNFINAVYEKYDATDSDHRMAIVTFSYGAAKLQGWTYVNESGKTTLTEAINGLPVKPTGGTQTNKGMAEAATLMGEQYKYTGSNISARQKVVILFTDGVPGIIGFDTNVADQALASAKVMKDKGVVIYTVGIFNGADKNELHGKEWVYKYADNIPCTGEVGSYWGGSFVSSLNGNNDFDEIDIAAGNRFLNYLSSNSETSTKIGIEKGSYNPGNVWGGGGLGWRIDANALSVDTTKGYYKTANDIDSLNNIFQSIQESIGGADDTTLSSETVVQDAVSKYFQIPSGSSATAHTETYTGEVNGVKTWSRNLDAWNLTPVKNSDGTTTVTATSFDFSENWVGPDENDNPHGKKLVIEIPIEPKTGFLGGNGVPTNDDANAGVYLADNLIENFPNTSASTNVPIADVYVDVTDKNIYLSQTVSAEDLVKDAKITIGDNDPLDMTKGKAEGYGLASWKYDFVDIEITSSGTSSDQTKDFGYTVTCTVKPKPSTDATAAGNTKSASGTVNVFKPVVTFQDSTIYLGTTPDYEDNYKGVVWKHGTTDADPTKMGNAPELAYSYDPLQSNVPTDCVDVNVNVAIDQNDVTDYVTFTDTRKDEYEFTVHVVRPTITFDDIEIYLSQTPTYTDESSFAWDDKCQCNLTERSAVAGEEPTFSYDYDPNADAFTECTEVNVTVKLGDVDYTNAVTLKNGDGTVRGTETAEFKVHVFLPRITLESQPLWADYDCDVALNKGIKSITITNWADQCGTKAEKQHTDALPQCSDPRYQFQRNGENITSYNAKNAQVTDYSTINVALDSVKIGATQYDMSVLPEVKPVEYKIHVNKFDLTINKTWNGADVYKQDAIFTVSGGRGPFQVVLPAGQDSIVIKGLLCGQKYEVTEDGNWTWRWNSSSEKPVLEKTDTAHTSVSVRNPHDQTDDGTNPGAHGAKSVSFTNTLKETLGELWFSFCTFVKNIFGAGRLEGRGN